ncbi:MAG: hypothetical protein EOO65_03805, partial [Methanosarcinales archaeon]
MVQAPGTPTRVVMLPPITARRTKQFPASKIHNTSSPEVSFTRDTTELGLGKSGIWSFDVNQTCLSFLAALDVAAMGFATGRFKRALVVSSDIASAGLDWETPASAAIFGDGAAAVCLEARSDDDGPALLSRRFETYGDGRDLAVLRSGGTRVRAEDGYEALLEGSRFRMDA